MLFPGSITNISAYESYLTYDVYQDDIELWYNCHRKTSDPTAASKGVEELKVSMGEDSSIAQKSIYDGDDSQVTDNQINFTTMIKSKLSSGEVLLIYNKNLKKAELRKIIESMVKPLNLSV